MDIFSITPAIRAESVPLERLADNPRLTEADQLREAARQFEAVLLRQILSEARKSLHGAGLGEADTSLGIYHDLMNQVLADSISRAGTLGLASSLQAELTRPSAAAEAATPRHEP